MNRQFYSGVATVKEAVAVQAGMGVDAVMKEGTMTVRIHSVFDARCLLTTSDVVYLIYWKSGEAD